MNFDNENIRTEHTTYIWNMKLFEKKLVFSFWLILIPFSFEIDWKLDYRRFWKSHFSSSNHIFRAQCSLRMCSKIFWVRAVLKTPRLCTLNYTVFFRERATRSKIIWFSKFLHRVITDALIFVLRDFIYSTLFDSQHKFC